MITFKNSKKLEEENKILLNGINLENFTSFIGNMSNITDFGALNINQSHLSNNYLTSSSSLDIVTSIDFDEVNYNTLSYLSSNDVNQNISYDVVNTDSISVDLIPTVSENISELNNGFSTTITSSATVSIAQENPLLSETNLNLNIVNN